MPIKNLSIIVDREIRSKGHNKEQETAVVSKMFKLSWFHEMFVAAKTYYAIMNGKDSKCLEMWVAKYKRINSEADQNIGIRYQYRH